MRKVVSGYLVRAGFPGPMNATGTADALPQMASADVVVADYSLHGETGLQVILAMRVAGYVGPALLISGYSAQDLPALPPGVGFLQKPFLAAELIDRLLALTGG